MIAGFSVVALAALFCAIGMAAKFMTPGLWNAASGVAVGGLVVYAAGRFLMVLRKKKHSGAPGDAGADAGRLL